MIEFRECKKDIGLNDLKRVENLLGDLLPQDYKDHLLKYNGGRCTPNTFIFEENGEVTESDIDWFLAIYEGEYDNLENYIKTSKMDEERLPKEFIPIAHDSGGNLICIHNVNEKVYFFDHEREESYKDLNLEGKEYLIANSFSEFLENVGQTME